MSLIYMYLFNDIRKACLVTIYGLRQVKTHFGLNYESRVHGKNRSLLYGNFSDPKGSKVQSWPSTRSFLNDTRSCLNDT